jgi:hypothetical protein
MAVKSASSADVLSQFVVTSENNTGLSPSFTYVANGCGYGYGDDKTRNELEPEAEPELLNNEHDDGLPVR